MSNFVYDIIIWLCCQKIQRQDRNCFEQLCDDSDLELGLQYRNDESKNVEEKEEENVCYICLQTPNVRYMRMPGQMCSCWIYICDDCIDRTIHQYSQCMVCRQPINFVSTIMEMSSNADLADLEIEIMLDRSESPLPPPQMPSPHESYGDGTYWFKIQCRIRRCLHWLLFGDIV